MEKRILLIGLGLMMVMLPNHLKAACSCHEDIQEMNMLAYNKTPVIFTGKAVSVGKCKNPQKVKFKAKKTFKGNPDNYTVFNRNCKSNCHLEFNAGRKYLVFAYYVNDSLSVKPCTRTRVILSKQTMNRHLKNIPESDSASRNEFKRKMEIWEHEIDFLKKAGNIKNGKASLEYTNGQVTAKGEFKDGRPDGKWTYYYPNGNLKAKGKYNNDGKRKGVWEEKATYQHYFEGYLADQHSTVRKFGNYENGEKAGYWEIHSIDGAIYTIVYKNSQIIAEKEPTNTEDIENFVPNFLTPNGNNVNDKLKIKNLPSRSSITVYNKYGSEIFKKDNYKNNWDAEDTPAGLYYYKITLPSNEIMKGWVHIIDKNPVIEKFD